jgi:hypothetical protein
MSKDHRLRTRNPLAKQSNVPLNFLLGCSEASLGNFELARLGEVADLRKELHATLDHMIDAAAQAALAAWFRTVNREDLKRRVLQTPDELFGEIMAQAKEEIRDGQRSEEELDAGPMPSNWIIRPSLPPGAAHLAASLRYSERNIVEGKCEKCPQPLDPNSVRYCTKHLAMHREKDRRDREKRGIQPGTRGRQPGTLANLARQREKRKWAMLAQLGVKPQHAAVAFNAVIEALARIMPRSKAEAMTQAQLFEKVGAISATTGRKALAEMLEAGAVERSGAGGIREPYRYWRKVTD